MYQAFTLYTPIRSKNETNGFGGSSQFVRLAPVLKTIVHQCVISYTCSQSNSDGSETETEPSELDWLQLYDMTH